jgi:glc operon protein GlcG
MELPSAHRHQGDGQILSGISASGGKPEIDKQIAQAGLDALLKK